MGRRTNVFLLLVVGLFFKANNGSGLLCYSGLCGVVWWCCGVVISMVWCHWLQVAEDVG